MTGGYFTEEILVDVRKTTGRVQIYITAGKLV
jgi:hypothetical protein